MLFEELTEVPLTLDIASDFLDRQPPMFRDDVCCFVSQSGETADTLRALEYCKERGAYIVGFTNTVGSAIARASDCGAFINAGNEIGVASTKAYTSQCIAIVLLAVRLAQDSVSKKAKLNTIVDALKTLPTIISKTLELDADMKALAESLKTAKSILIMGRGYQGATCYEAALKIKELTYIHAEGILTGELKHGSLALIDEELPVIVIATKDVHYDKAKAGLQQVVARKGKAIVLLSEPDPEAEKLAWKVVMVPHIGVDSLQGIVNIIPFQLLAYHLAIARGYDVDNPRNLAKSVTVE
jgi:glucosamine--fructose-6-phosphate aminotransferase (isomerizing)